MNKLFIYIITAMLIFYSNESVAFETTVKLKLDPDLSGTENEVITFGLPIAKSMIFDKQDISVFYKGIEQSIYIEDGLRWHWLDNSLRSVTIQLTNFDMRTNNVDKEIVIKKQKATKPRNKLKISPERGWTAASAKKAYIKYPRVFAIHDLNYLANTDIIPPYNITTLRQNQLTSLMGKKFTRLIEDLDYGTSTHGDWLYDRSSALFKAYLNSGDVRYLKEAFLSKQFYFSHIRNDGSNPSENGGTGCWQFRGVACQDGKYIYTQPAKLALALLGDNSQWDNNLIKNMSLQADLGNYQYNTRKITNKENQGFTERAAGITGLTEVVAFEITADKEVFNHYQQRINSLNDMQNSITYWEKKNNWVPKSGAFQHNWLVHENKSKPWNTAKNDTDNYRFSPWMSENIADFLWHAYQISDQSKISSMLLKLGNAIDNHGFASTYLSGTGNNAIYVRKNHYQSLISCHGHDNDAVELLYSASSVANDQKLAIEHNKNSYTDQHNIEIVLPLALAYYFSENRDEKNRLEARIEKILNHWLNDDIKDCSLSIGRNYRAFNWQYRSNSISTWFWIKPQF
ncbi:hypothetical protein JAO78_007800 [Alishewanella sp. 16-MA]|uniref:Uncharacterized protein n=1 Tax=Alishewanella maricola TaxID=2795740 RepID=A0ABS8C331_9ALTE|nr:hypothetical protein [Alishewanella maricola]MCB5226721.1 hypothetical protein [Alishewanella maricola]